MIDSIAGHTVRRVFSPKPLRTLSADLLQLADFTTGHTVRSIPDTLSADRKRTLPPYVIGGCPPVRLPGGAIVIAAAMITTAARTEQRNFILWWDGQEKAQGERTDLKLRRGPATKLKRSDLPVDKDTLHRWRTRLKDEARLRMLAGKKNDPSPDPDEGSMAPGRTLPPDVKEALSKGEAIEIAGKQIGGQYA